MPANHPAALATREAIKDIMRFWLSKGCDGFRVDMADSLVKGDDGAKSATCEIWRDIRRMLNAEFPDAVMVAEWNNPTLSLRAGSQRIRERGHAENTAEDWRGKLE